MIRHIVLIRPISLAQVEIEIDAISTLRGKIQGLKSFTFGRNESGINKGFSVFISFDFNDQESLNLWQINPAHDPIRENLLKSSEMIVLDYTF